MSSEVKSQPTLPEKPQIIALEGGAILMGSNVESDEKPTHRIKVGDFSIGKYPITVGQYSAFCIAARRVMPIAPRWGWIETHPIVNVNHSDAVAYCDWLSRELGEEYRLPTEAEWEYAARGGIKSKGYNYAGSNELEEVAWFAHNSKAQTQSVGLKKPNELDLFDMSGNVWELCKDWYHETYYENSPSQNPQGPAFGSYRVLRGGSWGNSFGFCRLAFRFSDNPINRLDCQGFRVALSQ